MKKAFTMSEVLIAMTVIGIVTALVIPNTFKGTQSKANSVVFKTTFAQFQQGMISAANIKKRDFVKIGESASNLDKTVEQLSKYLQKHFNLTKVSRSVPKDELEADDRYAVYSLKSGAQLIFNKASIETMKAHGCSNAHPCEAYIDVNGKRGPNKIVQCVDPDDTDADITATCTVSENFANDIFPVVIKNNHIYPGSNAVNDVLSK